MVVHSPKVACLKFSVKVVRHNIEINVGGGCGKMWGLIAKNGTAGLLAVIIMPE